MIRSYRCQIDILKVIHRLGKVSGSWISTNGMTSSAFRIRIVPTIGDIPAAAWDACANPHAAGDCGARPAAAESFSQREAYNPFISHAFLHALEASGSAVARAGWQPQHLVVETNDGAVAGVVPCYL